MKKETTKNKNVLVLEISGENGNLENYQKSLCEASLLGIVKLMFCCIWDNDQDKGAEIFNNLLENCETLNITPMSTVAGYTGEMFHGPMIGKMDELGNLTSFSDLIPFNEYKDSKGMVIEEEQVSKVLAKI